MANLVGIVTISGFGKSTSIGENEELEIIGLNPKETIIYNVKAKPLPFKGWKKKYNGLIREGGNYAEIADAKVMTESIQWVSENRKDIHTIVIDDRIMN